MLASPNRSPVLLAAAQPPPVLRRRWRTELWRVPPALPLLCIASSAASHPAKPAADQPRRFRARQGSAAGRDARERPCGCGFGVAGSGRCWWAWGAASTIGSLGCDSHDDACPAHLRWQYTPHGWSGSRVTRPGWCAGCAVRRAPCAAASIPGAAPSSGASHRAIGAHCATVGTTDCTGRYSPARPPRHRDRRP